MLKEYEKIEKITTKLKDSIQEYQKQIDAIKKSHDAENKKISSACEVFAGWVEKIKSSCTEFEKFINSVISKYYNEETQEVTEGKSKTPVKKVVKKYYDKKAVITGFATEDAIENLDNEKDFIGYSLRVFAGIGEIIRKIANSGMSGQDGNFATYANLRQKLNAIEKNYNKCLQSQLDLEHMKNVLESSTKQANEDNFNNIHSLIEKNIKDINVEYDKATDIEKNFDNTIRQLQINPQESAREFNSDIFVGLTETEKLNLDAKKLNVFASPTKNQISELGDFLAKIKRQKTYNEVVSIDLKELINQKGCIAIELAEDLTNKDAYYNLIKDFIMQFINKEPNKMVKIGYINKAIDSVMVGFLGDLGKGIGLDNIYHGAISKDQNITEHIENLVSKINGRLEQYGSSDTDIFKYNTEVSDNKQEVELLIVNNFRKLNQSQLDLIKSIIDSGPKCGIITLLVDDLSVKDGSYVSEETKNIIADFAKKCVYKFVLNTENITLNSKVFMPKMRDGGFDFGSYVQDLKHNASKIDTTVYLSSIFDEADYVKNKPYFGDKISLPIGKEGGSIRYLDFACNSSQCHGLITGTTGSGKSVMLHTLILASSYNYSPDEVQFYLIDFKDGVEFTKYSSQMMLPHVKYIAAHSDASDALDILKKLDAQKVRLNQLLASRGARDVTVYNNKPEVKNGTWEKIPHTFVIIDEFQVVFDGNNSTTDQCVEILTNLAKQGRNVGIHLILASQKIPTSRFAGILDQIDIRVCFKNDISLITDLIPSAKGRSETLDTGRAYLTTNRQDCTFVKTAYAPETGKNSMQEIHKSIIDKYPDYEITTSKAGEVKEAKFKDYSEIVCEQDQSEIFRAVVGINQITNEGEMVEFGDDIKKPFVILGNAKKSKHIEAVVMANIVNKIKTQNLSDCQIDYINLFLKRSSVYKDVANDFAKDNNIAIYTRENAKQRLSQLSEIFKDRKLGKTDNYSPIFVVVNSAEAIKDLKDETFAPSNLEDVYFSNSFSSMSGGDTDIKSVFAEGYKYSMFLIPQYDSYAEFRQLSFDIERTKCLILDKDELIAISNSLSKQSGTMNDTSAILIENDNVSKISLYQKEN